MSPGATVSLAVIEVILLTGDESQLSVATTETVTGTNLLFGGESTLGLTVTDWIVGTVESETVRTTVVELLLPAASATVTVILYWPATTTVPATGLWLI